MKFGHFDVDIDHDFKLVQRSIGKGNIHSAGEYFTLPILNIKIIMIIIVIVIIF